MEMFTLQFWKKVIKNFFQKDGIDAVTVLAYTSLVGFVPFLAVIVSVLSVTEAFQEKKAEALNQLLHHLLPTSTVKAEQYLIMFIQGASNLKGISILFVFLTALMLLWSIDEKINQMWDRRLQRRLWVSLLHYVGVSIFGPLMLVGGMFASSFFAAAPLFFETDIKNTFTSVLPIFFSLIGFLLIYRFVPIAKVNWQAAFFGAIFAAIELELLKWGFSLYVKWFPTYSLVYGAFAVIPLFLLWLYLLWLVVIFNASLVYQLMVPYQRKKELKEKRQEEKGKREVYVEESRQDAQNNM